MKKYLLVAMLAAGSLYGAPSTRNPRVPAPVFAKRAQPSRIAAAAKGLGLGTASALCLLYALHRSDDGQYGTCGAFYHKVQTNGLDYGAYRSMKSSDALGLGVKSAALLCVAVQSGLKALSQLKYSLTGE